MRNQTEKKTLINFCRLTKKKVSLHFFNLVFFVVIADENESTISKGKKGNKDFN